MDWKPLRGLIAATYTPFGAGGELALAAIPPMFAFLQEDQGVDGLYVCGSTGEGISLTTAERKQVTESYVRAAAGKLPVLVQVGHNSLAEAKSLARHAADVGASGISANAPSYFKVTTVAMLIECMAEIAGAAPKLPFYYYHIPHLTGAQLDMVEFLDRAGSRIPNLVGIKYTAPTLHEYRACVLAAGGQYDILFGSDEMLLPALAMGAGGAVGSTYNVAAPLYRHVMEHFRSGNLAEAQAYQDKCNAMIRVLYQFPFHSAMKCLLGMLGLPCGQCRAPQAVISAEQEAKLRAGLTAINFFEDLKQASAS